MPFPGGILTQPSSVIMRLEKLIIAAGQAEEDNAKAESANQPTPVE